MILIVDEAQGLSDEILEELRLLSDSRPPQRHALQIILVGQPELVRRLTDSKLRALNQRIGARALLRPLRGSEIHQYVNCLLRAHGARNDLFSSSALDQVACLSAGLPRKINNLCHNSLVHAYLERSSMVEPRHVRAASVELENLLDTSSEQDNQVRRGVWHWMLGKGKPVMAGCLSALAAVAVALALASFESRRPDAPLRNPTVSIRAAHRPWASSQSLCSQTLVKLTKRPKARNLLPHPCRPSNLPIMPLLHQNKRVSLPVVRQRRQLAQMLCGRSHRRCAPKQWAAR